MAEDQESVEHKITLADGSEYDLSGDRLKIATMIAQDVMLPKVVDLIFREQKCSTSFIQRKLAIGYNKAAKLVEKVEELGYISAANHVGKREMLMEDVPLEFAQALEASVALATMINEKAGPAINAAQAAVARKTRMKETPEDKEVADKAYSVTGQELRSFLERIERIQIDIDNSNADKAEVFAEAKGRGFDVTALKEVIKIRKADRDARAELNAVTSMYLEALGMSSDLLI